MEFGWKSSEETHKLIILKILWRSLFISRELNKLSHKAIKLSCIFFNDKSFESFVYFTAKRFVEFYSTPCWLAAENVDFVFWFILKKFCLFMLDLRTDPTDPTERTVCPNFDKIFFFEVFIDHRKHVSLRNGRKLFYFWYVFATLNSHQLYFRVSSYFIIMIMANHKIERKTIRFNQKTEKKWNCIELGYKRRKWKKFYESQKPDGKETFHSSILSELLK